MILLASRSPRRKAILNFIGIPFRVVKPDGVLEFKKSGESASGMVRRLAFDKAAAVSKKFPHHWILGADTVVSCGKKVFGKPRDRHEAALMLGALQNHSHEVWTGVALMRPGGKKTQQYSEKTRVMFRRLSSKEIDSYLGSKEPYDKAGAYDVQGTARHWIEKWDGDYFNILGLPVRWLITQLNRSRGKPPVNYSGKF
jgi:septum formation protein